MGKGAVAGTSRVLQKRGKSVLRPATVQKKPKQFAPLAPQHQRLAACVSTVIEQADEAEAEPSVTDKSDLPGLSDEVKTEPGPAEYQEGMNDVADDATTWKQPSYSCFGRESELSQVEAFFSPVAPPPPVLGPAAPPTPPAKWIAEVDAGQAFENIETQIGEKLTQDNIKKFEAQLDAKSAIPIEVNTQATLPNGGRQEIGIVERGADKWRLFIQIVYGKFVS